MCSSDLGLTIAEYHEWLVEIRGLNIGSLEGAPQEEDGSRDLLRYIADTQEIQPGQLLERRELTSLIATTIQGMPRPEKTVLSLYYFDELTLRDISKIMKLHESRISQLKTQGILRLRAVIEKQWPSTRGGGF